MSSTLRASRAPLCREHDVAMLDLDGVVYVGRDAVPGAPEALAQARSAGLRLAFVTNNAARTPQAVAEHLNELGIAAEPSEVITSAQAAARYLADRFPAGSKVLVVGTDGLIDAVRERGLVPVQRAGDGVVAVVQGYSPQLGYSDLVEGAVAIRTGVLWVATNLDATVPSPRGPLPGNGSLVGALRVATRVEPISTGKPDPTMHRETLIRTGAARPVVVGDRLDTDIEGANAVGCPSLLVLSGVCTPADLLDAPVHQRPTYLGADVRAVLDQHREPRLQGEQARCGRWIAARDGDALHLTVDGEAPSNAPAESPATGTVNGDALDALRALCAARWSFWTEQGSSADSTLPGDPGAAAPGGGPATTASGDDATRILTALGLVGS